MVLLGEDVLWMQVPRSCAVEMNLDALCDREGNVTICAIMEHIEQAGIHSGLCADCHFALERSL